MSRTEAEPRTETILLLFDRDRDRSLLRDWLQTVPGYSVVTDLEGHDRPDYDLVILDRGAFERHRATIEAHQTAVDPLFLPVVTAVSSRSNGAGRASLPADADALVDDVIELPIGKAALRRRLENLLQARRASVRLAERESQYRNLVELTPEAILLLQAGGIVYANAAAAEMFGVDAAELDGRPLTEFVPPDAQAGVEEVLDRIERDGSLGEYVTCDFESARGESIIGTTAGVRITYEGTPTTQLLIRDVTAERERRERLDLFGRAIDAAKQGITIADAQADDEPLIYANAAFERITGYPVPEILGENCRFLQGENTDRTTVTQLRTAIDARKPVAVEILNYRKDGTPFWNQLEIVPIADEDGTVTHFLGLQQDITQRREREEQLAVMSRVLRHNIRNRVNVIQGYASELDDADIATRITDAADELLQISNRVREFRDLRTRKAHLDDVDLSKTLDRVVGGVKDAYPDATIEVECPPEIRVRTHPLLVSALEEVMELALQEDPTAPLELTVEPTDGGIGIVLTDVENNIPATGLAALTRGAENPIEHPQGVGLWLLKWAVLHAGGDFAVDTEADPRTIRIRLSAARAAADEASDDNGRA